MPSKIAQTQLLKPGGKRTEESRFMKDDVGINPFFVLLALPLATTHKSMPISRNKKKR
ncbi:MAG: hypothetical protein NWE98_00985 [Candidatus Bathyarchaeota archaeon]|nr:hypothetical protein [Candidatus Bathyarchaeota archaeon]